MERNNAMSQDIEHPVNPFTVYTDEMDITATSFTRLQKSFWTPNQTYEGADYIITGLNLSSHEG